eukprot:Rhum_TRINITY_DN4012_c0_g1::Rhum_TRINITY_DN4012_c0_g1_i1::g.12729::m.12729/K13110/MFAP1; microfibrillar-associated protein 1
MARVVRKEERQEGKYMKKTTRYRPGKKAEMYNDDDDEDMADSDASAGDNVFAKAAPAAAAARHIRIEHKDDSRLSRVASAAPAAAAGAAPPSVASQLRRRAVREAEVIEEAPAGGAAKKSAAAAEKAEASSDEEVDSDDSDAFERRRELARRKRAQQTQKRDEQLIDRLPEGALRAAAAAPSSAAAGGAGVGGGDEEEEEEYEEVTESESEDAARRQQLIARPVFVSRTNRVTDLEWKKKELEEEAEEERLTALRQRRREEVKRMAIEEIKRREDGNDEAESDGELPDDDDTKDMLSGLAMQLWRIREQKRIERYQTEREAEEQEKIELERRRNLTDEQRREEDVKYDQKLIAMGLNKSKAKLNFMQKYYHKGAYYQATEEKGLEKEDIYRRDYNEAVGADNFNKELLPGVMQVRGGDFGKRGQSKWTHLTAEDTAHNQKDKYGGEVDYSFATATFASGKSTQSNNLAYQNAENQMMFRNEKLGDLTPQAIGSAKYAGGKHKDQTFDRPSRRAK